MCPPVFPSPPGRRPLSPPDVRIPEVIALKNEILQQYIRLTEFLGRALGPDYEVALHDLTTTDRSIIAIANSHISGRSIGAPLTNVALQILADQSYLTSDYRINYRGLSAGNKLLRSSTYFIKDEEGRMIGLLCVNFDDSRYRELSDRVLQLCHPDAFVGTSFAFDQSRLAHPADDDSPIEHFPGSIGAAAVDAVNDTLEEMGAAAEHLTQDEKMHVVAQLESQGVFLLKGAVRDVAERLHCSQASVYRYLTRIRGQHDRKE